MNKIMSIQLFMLSVPYSWCLSQCPLSQCPHSTGRWSPTASADLLAVATLVADSVPPGSIPGASRLMPNRSPRLENDANWLWLVMTSLWWILCHVVNVVICFVNSLIHLGPSLCCVMFTLWTLIKIIWNTSWKDHFLGILGVPYGFVKLPGSKKGLLLLPSKTFPSMGKFHRRDTKVRVLWRHHEVNMPIWGLVKTYEIPYLEGMNMHFPQWRNETYT